MKMKNKAIRYRLYPNKKQIIMLAKFFGCVRFVYNYFLALKIKTYEETGRSISCTKSIKMLPSLKKFYPRRVEVDSIALQQCLRHLDKAFKNFFEKRSGYPKFKKKGVNASYTTVLTNNNIRIENGHIRLPRIGDIKIRQHKDIPDGWEISSATVKQLSNGEYYVSVLFKYENQVQEVAPEKALGLDYSSPYLYIDSDGNEPDYEKPFRKYADKLAREQKKLSEMREHAKKAGRKLSECKNYQKQKAKVSDIYNKIANCRKDALHKLSLHLAESYDVIGVEDLDMKALSQCLNLGKNTMDNGWGMFLRMLEYKLEDRGKHFVKISKWHPSTKTCSCCGNIKPVRLDERTYVCPECGTVIDRDLNAAINIREEALRMLTA